ncbi:putative benzoate 4-monooxygenase cytochrome P450 protein [Rosellinia necatrix]|uniref:Putative benzoate 4-monooxygenase cytochrome P450 protein n=1 Tax=Rosellinia necatrix TaxID=77044 RepID=A0A1W2TQ97_ROSNE|nr:putative benzoate 4-monooxygenase cytochrome P450 protein [Rosellinia necatrix]
MRAFEPTMQKEIGIFLGRLLTPGRNGSSVDMTPRCAYLAVDIIGQLAFGYALKTQTVATNRSVSVGLNAMSTVNSLLMAWPHLSIPASVLTRLGSKTASEFRGVLLKMIGARKAIPRDEKNDLYASISNDMSDAELWPEAIFLLAAGGGTVHTTMAVIFFYLSRNSAAYIRLAHEIRAKFSNSQEIRQGAQLTGCKYLRAVIDESLRISPSSLQVTWREQAQSSVAAGETLAIDGHVIPPGTQIAVNFYSLFHNPTYFPDPFTFRPERWLPEEQGSSEQEEQRIIMRRAFQPSLLGDRGCAGKPMAYMELSLIIAKTLWYFDFHKAPGEAGMVGEGNAKSTDGRHRRDEF